MPNTASEPRQYPTNPNDYKISEDIGQGVSATVYKALCKPFNETVAIKSLDLEKCNSSLDDIRKEAQMMVLIHHPNVVRAYCSFVKDQHLWVVMPYMAGGSCLHIMKSHYPDGFDEPMIATILRETLKALDYLHRHGDIHRDVKAGNILIDRMGNIKLGDFGVSACMFDMGDRQRARKTFCGTPCWMAPEVMEQLHGYDFKADIWSFGITALELAHGHAPFSKYPPMKVLLMTLQNAPPGLGDYDSDRRFSRAMKEMIAMCLVKDPSKRPTAEKLLKHSFFKQAKGPEYVARVIENLPPLGERVKALKAKDEARIAASKLPTTMQEEMSQNEYKRGVSGWNFDVEDLKRQAALLPDDDGPTLPATVKEEDERSSRQGSKRDSEADLQEMQPSLGPSLSFEREKEKERDRDRDRERERERDRDRERERERERDREREREREKEREKMEKMEKVSISTSSKPGPLSSLGQPSGPAKEIQRSGPLDFERFQPQQSLLAVHTLKGEISTTEAGDRGVTRVRSGALPTASGQQKMTNGPNRPGPLTQGRKEPVTKGRFEVFEDDDDQDEDGEADGSDWHEDLQKRNINVSMSDRNLSNRSWLRESDREKDHRSVQKGPEELSQSRGRERERKEMGSMNGPSVNGVMSSTRSSATSSVHGMVEGSGGEIKRASGIQQKGRFSVTTEGDGSEEVAPLPIKRITGLSHGVDKGSSSQPVTPNSQPGTTVPVAAILPHLQNLMKHAAEQQDVVFHLLSNLMPSEISNKGMFSRGNSAMASGEFGMELPSERERELLQQVAELQARVTSLLEEMQSLKIKNTQMHHQLNVFYNKETEERIRKEEAAREDG